MKNLITVALFMLCYGLVPTSCNKCYNPCCEDSREVRDFEILSFSARSQHVNWSQLDSTAYYDNDSVVKEILIDEKKDVVWNQVRPEVSMFSNMAYACSPRDPVSVQKIAELKIISRSNTGLQSASDIITNGENISERFQISASRGYGYRPLAEHVSLNMPLSPWDALWIKLNNEVYQPTDLQFDIVITLTDGKTQTFSNQHLLVD